MKLTEAASKDMKSPFDNLNYTRQMIARREILLTPLNFSDIKGTLKKIEEIINKVAQMSDEEILK